MRFTWFHIGLLFGALLLFLKLLAYLYFSGTLSIELYTGTLAMIFLGFGILFGHWRTSDDSSGGDEPLRSSLDLALLTEREYHVLELMARGYSNQEIADSLYLSLSTIKTHVSSILNKLDVKRRTQAILEAQRRGWIR